MAPESASARTFVAACVLVFLFHNVAAATSPPPSFSFDFSNTSKYSVGDLRFELDAALNLNRDLVDLTCSDDTLFCMGRMSYNHPVALYDNTTGEVASFVTTFTFSIKLSPNTTQKGDGMTFFLTGYPSSLLKGWGTSGLGLINSSATIPTGADRFIAIEFDTFNNGANDPTGSSDHIGIDINSLTSVSALRLPSYSLNGTMTATITFDNATRMLEATLHFDADRSLDPVSVKTQLPDQLDALLPPVVAVGFSAVTGAYTELHQIHSWSFNSTMAARDTPTGANGSHPNQGEVFGIRGRQGQSLVIGGLVILVLAVVVAIWSTLSWCRLKRIRDSFGKDSRLKQFEYSDLSMATDRFSEKKEIGKGGFGVVYSGSLKKKHVAVKKILKDSRGEFKDFLAELGAIDGTGHVNLVRLEGWCCSINNYMFWCMGRTNVELFLVYELVPNGNLHQHLYEKPEVLSWENRHKIVKGLCNALNYLHHQCAQYILHRDIKPGNILLDSEFNPKLGDFGLSRVAENNNVTSVQTEAAAGTRRYMDPQSMTDGQANLRRSSDVYSFGIVLLEIAHGKYNPGLVRHLHRNRPYTFVEDVADERLAGQFDRVQMERVIVLGLRCCEEVASKRPSLDAAAMQFLESGGELHAATMYKDEPRPTVAPI
ncbi:hypothetical protein QYE76_024691 [Lolium multiflorum]|uniref:Protein kinase domain-containing protein n=1 Tax=Lolium multiflorum TaxID=4521 RepID=A0AAD8VTV9_LOLMU|nr:hypothetical protein QYE76_024691 [Lolium multiflorum]